MGNGDYVAGYSQEQKRRRRKIRREQLQNLITIVLLYGFVALFFMVVGVQVGRYLERENPKNLIFQEQP